MTPFRQLIATVCLLSLFTAVSSATTSISTPTSSVPTSFHGLTQLSIGTGSSFPAVPFSTVRMWDTGTRWNLMEKSRGSYSWGRADSIVNLARSKGKDIIYTFGSTPQWASSNPSQNCTYGYGSCAAPKYMSDLSTFAKAVASRYKGRIKYYELWNEPNDTHYYTGSISSMVTMARTIHDAIKSVDPNAVILSPCPTWSSSGAPYTWMNSFLSAGGGSTFDVMSYHAYGGPNSAEFIVNSVQNMRNALNNHGYGSKQIYITEGGWGENKYVSTEDSRANYLARYLVLAWAKGVKKVTWYAYDSTSWGTLYSSGSLRPAGTAYNNVYKWLTGAVMTGCNQDSNSTWRCTLTRSNGYSAQIIWNPSKSTGVNVSSSYTRKRTLSGGLSTFSSGYVTVGPKPILVENKAGF